MTSDLPQLTPLQREILALAMNGLTNREIANRLDLTPGTVGVQMGRVVKKLGLTSRVEIAAWAIEQTRRVRSP
jgi:two-component system nitrate/nitrite response regulator NarL